MKPTLHESTTPAVVGDRDAQVAHQQVEGVTPDSIARAQQAQAAERAEVLNRLGPGWSFTADGRLQRKLVCPWGLSPFYLSDHIEAGLTAANFIAAAIYGTPNTKH